MLMNVLNFHTQFSQFSISFGFALSAGVCERFRPAAYRILGPLCIRL